MNTNRLICLFASLLVCGACEATAQSRPATIPTIVAQAMMFEPESFGRPQFFDARVPTSWPAGLTPPAAKVLGGGMVGDSVMYRMRVAVFEFPAQSNPRPVIEDMLTRAGYVHLASEDTHPPHGGFAETPAPTAGGKYCKGSTLAMFGVIDSVGAPVDVAMSLLDGQVGRVNCDPRNAEAIARRFPVTIPSLTPPAGVLSSGTGSSWSDSNGGMTTTLRTTLPTDSVLAHYSAQLVSAGWTLDGRTANTDGIAVQRFAFREGQDAWTGALIVMAAGDRREVLLQVARNE